MTTLLLLGAAALLAVGKRERRPSAVSLARLGRLGPHLSHCPCEMASILPGLCYARCDRSIAARAYLQTVVAHWELP